MNNTKLLGLIENYRRDLVDYEQLYEGMVCFQQQLPDNLLDEAETTESYAQDLNAYMEKRNRQFADIMARAQQSSQTAGELAGDLGLDQFNLTNLRKTATDPNLVLKLEQILAALTAAMEKVIELDRRIVNKLKMDYEATKLQIHRFSSGQKIKNAYRNDQQTEAFFIDKNN